MATCSRCKRATRWYWVCHRAIVVTNQVHYSTTAPTVTLCNPCMQELLATPACRTDPQPARQKRRYSKTSVWRANQRAKRTSTERAT